MDTTYTQSARTIGVVQTQKQGTLDLGRQGAPYVGQGQGSNFFVALAALCPKGAPDLGRPSKIFSLPTRWHIPVFKNLFFEPKKTFLPGFLRISFFSWVSGGIFHRNVVLEGVAGIPDFCRCHRNFLQEFLGDRNSCIYPGFLRIPPDSCSH